MPLEKLISKGKLFLGRIISSSKKIEVPSYIEVTAKYTESTIPTLIVGKKKAIELFGDENVHVLDKTISETVKWTYAKNERRDFFEEDIANFIAEIEHRALSSVKYYFINIFTEKLSFIKKFVKWLKSGVKITAYVTKKEIYFYGGKEVVGVSTVDFEYIGIPTAKIIRKLQEIPSIELVTASITDSVMPSAFKSKKNILFPYLRYHNMA